MKRTYYNLVSGTFSEVINSCLSNRVSGSTKHIGISLKCQQKGHNLDIHFHIVGITIPNQNFTSLVI